MSNESSEKESLGLRLLKGLKNQVWEDDVKANTSKQPEASAPNVQGAAQASVTVNTGAATAASSPVVPNKMAEELMAMVMSRPTPYSAFSEAISALSDMPIDEATKYASAFRVLQKTQSRTVDQISQAIDVHLAALDSETLRFANQSRSQEDAEITARTKEAATLRQSVEQINAQIEKIRADAEANIQRLQSDAVGRSQRADEIDGQVLQQRQAIESTKRDFDAAAEHVKSALAAEKLKVQKYLTK